MTTSLPLSMQKQFVIDVASFGYEDFIQTPWALDTILEDTRIYPGYTRGSHGRRQIQNLLAKWKKVCKDERSFYEKVYFRLVGI